MVALASEALRPPPSRKPGTEMTREALPCPLWVVSGHCEGSARCGFVPIADIAPELLDHVVSAGQECRWYSKAERFGCLEIDQQFVFGRRLHRHISRLLTL